MGNSVDWQSEFAVKLSDLNVTLFNPRRDFWGGSADYDNIEFIRQVTWEMDNLDRSTVIAMNIEGTSKSPITLLELGMFAASGKLLVRCGNSYHRRGNVRAVCSRYEIPMYETLTDLANATRERVTACLR